MIPWAYTAPNHISFWIQLRISLIIVMSCVFGLRIQPRNYEIYELIDVQILGFLQLLLRNKGRTCVRVLGSHDRGYRCRNGFAPSLMLSPNLIASLLHISKDVMFKTVRWSCSLGLPNPNKNQGKSCSSLSLLWGSHLAFKCLIFVIKSRKESLPCFTSWQGSISDLLENTPKWMTPFTFPTYSSPHP